MPKNALEIVTARSQKAAEKTAEKALNTPPKRVSKKDPGQLSVSMRNELANAAHRLTLTEKRIMMFAVAKIDSRRATNPFEKLTVTITASEYAKVYKVDLSTAYTELSTATVRLYERTIGWSRRDAESQGEDERWISGKKYHAGQGWVAVTVNHKILPLLTLLRGKFVSYKLAQASALRSVYSWRLLELLTQFKSKGWRQDSIQDFVRAMEVPETYSQNFAQLRRWVIEPAIKELQEKDGWVIAWEPLKLGRKVTALRFEFSRNPQRGLPL